MSYLLDTCVISDLFKKLPQVIARFETISPDEIYISSIAIMEIEYGLKLNSEREKKIRPNWESLLKYIHILQFSPKCAISSASIRSGLKNTGTLIGPYDILMAGTSLAHDLILVTSNTGEFERVKGLTIENWRE